MSKSIYTGVSDIARASKKFYIGDTDSKARKVKKMYIGDSDKKARLCYQSVFTWKKYVSEVYGTHYPYYDTYSTAELTFAGCSIKISITDLVNGLYDENFIYTSDDNRHYYIKIGDGFTYNTTHGSFILTNEQEYRLGYTLSDDSMSFGLSNYEIEQNLIGKYIRELNDNSCVYKIVDHNDTDLLNLDIKYERGALCYRYHYVYKEDVTSEDENAYESSSSSVINSSYSVTTNTDIRTVYVKQ